MIRAAYAMRTQISAAPLWSWSWRGLKVLDRDCRSCAVPAAGEARGESTSSTPASSALAPRVASAPGRRPEAASSCETRQSRTPDDRYAC